MIGKITSDVASKIKNTDWQKIRHSLNPIATNSHLEGAFSSTGDSLLIRKISKLEQEGNFDKIKSISSKLYERMLKMDEEFKKLPPVIFARNITVELWEKITKVSKSCKKQTKET